MDINLQMFDKYKNQVLNIAVILIAFFIAGNIYNGQSLKVKTLQEKKKTEGKKNGLLDGLSGLQNKADAYKKLFNKKDISLLINNINAMAKDSGVKIISVRPQAEKENPDYIQYPFSLVVSADDYHGLGRFIARLESSPDIYKIESINIKPVSSGQRESEEGMLAADMVLNTFLIK